MKIGILTHYQAESHGACLQHYALTRYLTQLGHEVHTITYQRSFSFSTHEDKQKFSVSLRSFPYYIREYLFRKGLSHTWTMVRKHSCLHHFRRNCFSFLPQSEDFDVIIVGSDEVWSLQMGLTPVLFGHGLNCGRLIAYAPSFGQTRHSDIFSRGCLEILREGLSRFHSISVRDTHSQVLVEQLIGRIPAIVCDPALLYDFGKELANCSVDKPDTPYVVVYAYSSDLNEPERIAAIREYARSIGARVFSAGGHHRWCDKQIICDPLALLGWFRNASAIVTDTFHGTIYAALTETPMAIYIRSTNQNKLSHLVSALQLDNRMVSSSHSLSDILNTSVDFDHLRATIQSLRAFGQRWLSQALDESD